jgi:hypothetical protein
LPSHCAAPNPAQQTCPASHVAALVQSMVKPLGQLPPLEMHEKSLSVAQHDSVARSQVSPPHAIVVTGAPPEPAVEAALEALAPPALAALLLVADELAASLPVVDAPPLPGVPPTPTPAPAPLAAATEAGPAPPAPGVPLSPGRSPSKSLVQAISHKPETKSSPGARKIP